MLLDVSRINTYYGISHILFDLTLKIDEGEVVCILGRNGVGKTTTVRSIMGLTPPVSGSVIFRGVEIRGKKPYEIARLGIGFVPEDRVIFPDLTVKENLEMGIKRNNGGRWNLETLYQIFPILNDRKSQRGGSLSGGEQQMLTIARTLMGNPKLLMLDEPSEGLAPIIVRELGIQIRKLKDQRMPILLVEQNSTFTLKLSDRAYIIEKGQVRWEGNVTELRQRPDIMQTHLGV